ncbi:MAG: hypothetical protein H6878_02550 [Rhodobiaceae bacterium]|nr:hypothetical protein [Rhodobiaceae bacterium]MCC0015164.1 hypothetical protein [Rhodobiaceae bacterium]MCC0040768.1 hypothetical protein [Rhodobiaceae bacterium]MCC0053595.1 hypothetical protein [Rhodobiaceae bacterium]
MTDPTRYTHTYHLFRKARSYMLTNDALTWEDEGAEGVHSLPFAMINDVRLAYRPTRVQRNRYLAHIQPKAGKRIDISNSSFKGFGSFIEHNEEYAAFIRELHRRLADAGVQATFHKGSSLMGYIGNLLLTAWIVAMLGLALVLLLSWGFMWIAVVKLVVIAFFIPTLIRFIIRARPQTYDPRDIPDGALPQVA